MDTPSDMTYALVVSRDRLQISLILTVLNNLDVFYADVQNAYLNAPPHENYWFKAVPEFVQYNGRIFVIVQALYGIASSVASCRNELSKTMRYLGFSLCLTDPYVLMHAATKPDGYKYWDYILVHSYGLLVIYHLYKLVMKGFDTAYTLKPDANGKKWADPTTYLVDYIEKL